MAIKSDCRLFAEQKQQGEHSKLHYKDNENPKREASFDYCFWPLNDEFQLDGLFRIYYGGNMDKEFTSFTQENIAIMKRTRASLRRCPFSLLKSKKPAASQ